AAQPQHPARGGGMVGVEELVLVLDFGSQYSQLIARRVREAGVYCELIPGTTPWEAIRARTPRALILSGGPASVYVDGAPLVDRGHDRWCRAVRHRLPPGGHSYPTGSRDYPELSL